MLLPVAALAGQGEDLLGLLEGEFNNHEQVWQQRLDDATAVKRQHWRFERTDKLSLELALAPGQVATAPNWVVELRPGSLDTGIAPIGGEDSNCVYRWRPEGDGFVGAPTTAATCPGALPDYWRVTATHLFSGNGAAGEAALHRARRVQYYSGWVSMQRRHIDVDAAADDFILMRNLRMHDEGFIVPITDAGEATGYALELARLTYQNTRVAVLKIGIIDEATGDTLSYAWGAPGTVRIGINLRWVQAGLTRED